MCGLNSERNFTIEDLRKVAGIIDFVVYLVRTVSEHINMLCSNIVSLANTYTTLGTAKIIDEVHASMKSSADLIVNIMPF